MDVLFALVPIQPGVDHLALPVSPFHSSEFWHLNFNCLSIRNLTAQILLEGDSLSSFFSVPFRLRHVFCSSIDFYLTAPAVSAKTTRPSIAAPPSTFCCSTRPPLFVFCFSKTFTPTSSSEQSCSIQSSSILGDHRHWYWFLHVIGPVSKTKLLSRKSRQFTVHRQPHCN